MSRAIGSSCHCERNIDVIHESIRSLSVRFSSSSTGRHREAVQYSGARLVPSFKLLWLSGIFLPSILKYHAMASRSGYTTVHRHGVPVRPSWSRLLSVCLCCFLNYFREKSSMSLQNDIHVPTERHPSLYHSFQLSFYTQYVVHTKPREAGYEVFYVIYKNSINWCNRSSVSHKEIPTATRRYRRQPFPHCPRRLLPRRL